MITSDDVPALLFGGPGYKSADWVKVWSLEEDVFEGQHYYDTRGEYHPAGDAPASAISRVLKQATAVCSCGYQDECAVHCGQGHETGACAPETMTLIEPEHKLPIHEALVDVRAIQSVYAYGDENNPGVRFNANAGDRLRLPHTLAQDLYRRGWVNAVNGDGDDLYDRITGCECVSCTGGIVATYKPGGTKEIVRKVAKNDGRVLYQRSEPARPATDRCNRKDLALCLAAFIILILCLTGVFG